MVDRVLAGIVFIAEGKILLVLSRKDECHGRWSIPKGRYREASDGGVFAAAVRELKEETGIDLVRLGGRGLTEADCIAKGTLSYARKGQPVDLRYFVIECHEVILDSFSTAGEAMSGVGFFAPSLARKLIRQEQRPLLEALDQSAIQRPVRRRPGSKPSTSRKVHHPQGKTSAEEPVRPTRSDDLGVISALR